MKKQKNFLKAIKKVLNAPFEFDESADTFQLKYILRGPLALCIGALFLCATGYLNKLYIHNNGIAWLIGAPVAYYCLACAIVALAYLMEVADKRKQKSPKASRAKKTKKIESRNYTFDQFLKMMDENDILDVVIQNNGHKVSIRASSDLTPDSEGFFDKAFYIGKTEYQTLEQLADALSQLLGTQADVEVLSIDGLAPKYFK